MLYTPNGAFFNCIPLLRAWQGTCCLLCYPWWFPLSVFLLWFYSIVTGKEKKKKKGKTKSPLFHSYYIPSYAEYFCGGFYNWLPPPPAAFHTWLEAKLENGPWWHRDTSGSSQAMASHPSLRLYVQGCKLRGNVWASVQSESHTCPVRK